MVRVARENDSSRSSSPTLLPLSLSPSSSSTTSPGESHGKKKKKKKMALGDVFSLYDYVSQHVQVTKWGRDARPGIHLGVDVFALCSASVIYSMILVTDSIAAIMDPHKSHVIYVATVSIVTWNVVQAFSPFIVYLLNVLGRNVVGGASAIAVAAGLRMVGNAVQTKNHGDLFFGWAVLIGVGCSVLQVSTIIQARLYFSKVESSDAQWVGFESLTFVWALFLAFFHHIQTALDLSVHRVIFNQSLLAYLIAMMTIFSSSGRNSHFSSWLLHKSLQQASRTTKSDSRNTAGRPCETFMKSDAEDIEEARSGLVKSIKKDDGCVGSVFRGIRDIPLRAMKYDLWRCGCMCLIHILVMTPLLSTMILMPMTLNVVFSSSLAVHQLYLSPSSPSTIIIGLLVYGLSQGITFALQRAVPTPAVYMSICSISCFTFFFMPYWASEDTHLLFIAAQCLQVSFIRSINSLISEYVGGSVDRHAVDVCIGLIRIATAATSFFAVICGSSALGIPIGSDRVSNDPVEIEIGTSRFYFGMALLQLLAVPMIQFAKKSFLEEKASKRTTKAACPTLRLALWWESRSERIAAKKNFFRWMSQVNI